jgi:hypothetical protein
MAFNAQPNTQVSAYRPIKFVFDSGTTTDIIEKLAVEIYDAEDDRLLATYRKDWTSRSGTDPNYDYECEFDISGLVQALLDPLPSAKSAVFPDPDALNGYSHNSSLWLYVKCQWEARNVDNLLEAIGSQTTSNTIYAFNLAQQHDEEQGLSDYIDSGARKVLHDQPPGGIDIRVTDAFWLCCILNSAITRARYTIYHTDGSTSNENIILSWPDAASNSNKKVVMVGVGPRTANAYFTITEADVERYEVFLADGSNNPLTETLSFNILPKCAGRELRVHWMNDRGGADSYTFDGIKRRMADVKSGIGEKPLVWNAVAVTNHDRNQRGRYRTDIRRADVWEVETRILDEDVAEWITGIIDSPEVYIEQVGLDYYLPAMIIDGRVIYKDTEQVGAILKMSIGMANDKIQPRN